MFDGWVMLHPMFYVHHWGRFFLRQDEHGSFVTYEFLRRKVLKKGAEILGDAAENQRFPMVPDG